MFKKALPFINWEFFPKVRVMLIQTEENRVREEAKDLGGSVGTLQEGWSFSHGSEPSQLLYSEDNGNSDQAENSFPPKLHPF